MPTSHQNRFESMPRTVFTQSPTPLRPLDRLAEHLGRPKGSLWVKRDDLTELAAGGNKVRKLEYVLPEALASSATCLVTGGGVQSNSARATAAAAAEFGLRARLVLDGREPEAYTGNLALDHILGAHVTYRACSGDAELEQAIVDEAARAQADGEQPYVVPVGVSTPLGALGYVRCAHEIRQQLPAVDLTVVATGSAGTHAGLVAGFGDHRAVLGVRVGARQGLPERVEHIAAEAAELAGLARPSGRCELDEDHLGDGYARPTAEGDEAIRLAARLEGLILDPVYTGKAMAALIARCQDGSIELDQQVVFVHTGGMPGLLARGRDDRSARAALVA